MDIFLGGTPTPFSTPRCNHAFRTCRRHLPSAKAMMRTVLSSSWLISFRLRVGMFLRMNR